MKKTLFDKVWDAHIVESVAEGPQILYIDKHLIHEVTSPQAFNELKQREIPIFRPQLLIIIHQQKINTYQLKTSCPEISLKNFQKTVLRIISHCIN